MRIERLIPCSPKELWHALIQHTELTECYATMRLALPSALAETVGRITVYESHKVLECVWGGNVLRWELQGRGCSTLLVFTHAENAAPWLACLDSIAALATRRTEAAI